MAPADLSLCMNNHSRTRTLELRRTPAIRPDKYLLWGGTHRKNVYLSAKKCLKILFKRKKLRNLF